MAATVNECRVDDDGGPEIVAIEAGEPDLGDEPQSLWVRVGPVFGPDGAHWDEPGVWICYQEKHMAGPQQGPVLLTPAVWRELNTAVEERLADRGV